MKNLLAAGAAVLALTVLAACGGGDSSTAEDPADAPTTAETTTPVDGSTAEPGGFPAFAPEDYTYLLEVICYCPLTGPVEVTVQGGEVASAVYTRSGHGVTKGEDAPDFMRKTINDVIEAANDTDAAEVDVEWPEGQDHPSSVFVDQDRRMIDEEITYVVRRVEVSAG